MDRNTDKYHYKKNIIEKKNIDISNNSKELKKTLDLIHKTLISLRKESASSPAPSASLSAASASLSAARASLSAARRASSSASGRAWTRSVNSPAAREYSPVPRASLSAATAEAEARAARIKERRVESNKKLPPYEDYSPPRTRQFTPAGPPSSPFSRRRNGLSVDSEGNVSGSRSRGDVRGHISRRIHLT